MQSWFGANVPKFRLRVGKKGSSIEFVIIIDPVVKFTLKDFFDRLIDYNSEFGDLLGVAINSMQLDKIGLTVREFGVNINPFGLRLSGTAFMGSRT